MKAKFLIFITVIISWHTISAQIKNDVELDKLILHGDFLAIDSIITHRLNSSSMSHTDSCTLYYYGAKIYYQHLFLPNGSDYLEKFEKCISGNAAYNSNYLELLKWSLYGEYYRRDSLVLEQQYAKAASLLKNFSENDKTDSIEFLFTKLYSLVDKLPPSGQDLLLDSIKLLIDLNQTENKFLLAEYYQNKGRVGHGSGIRLKGFQDISKGINLLKEEVPLSNPQYILIRYLGGVLLRYLDYEQSNEILAVTDSIYKDFEKYYGEESALAPAIYNLKSTNILINGNNLKEALYFNELGLNLLHKNYTWQKTQIGIYYYNNCEINIRLGNYEKAYDSALKSGNLEKLATATYLSGDKNQAQEVAYKFAQSIIENQLQEKYFHSDTEFESGKVILDDDYQIILNMLLNKDSIVSNKFMTQALNYDIIQSNSTIIRQYVFKNQLEQKKGTQQDIEYKRIQSVLNDQYHKMDAISNEDSLISSYNSIQRSIYAETNRNSSFNKINLISNYDEIKSKLINNEAVIKIISYKKWGFAINMYGLFIIRQHDEHPIYIPIAEEKELIAFLNTYDVNIYSINNFSKDYAENIIINLLKKMKPFLSDIKTAHVVQAGIFNNINFNLILSNYFPETVFKHGNYLFTNFKKSNKPNKNNFVFIGDIEYDKNQMPNSFALNSLRGKHRGMGKNGWLNLPYSKEEVVKCAAVVRSNNLKSEVISKEKATTQNILNHAQTHLKGIHFAGHGFAVLDSQLNINNVHKNLNIFTYGAFCGLATIPTPSNNGIISAFQIINLDLFDTEMVVLSACETASTKLIPGNKSVSVASLFKQAGAQKVLASLWQVPDESTKDLMIEFYKNWLNKKQAPHIALANAQKKIRKKYVDPIHWAGWVLLE